MNYKNPEFNEIEIDKGIQVPNINSPHPERGKLVKDAFEDNKKSSTDEMESEEQTCLDEDD